MKKIRILNETIGETVALRMPPEVVTYIKQAAEQSMSSKSQWVRDAIYAKLRLEGCIAETDDLDVVSA